MPETSGHKTTSVAVAERWYYVGLLHGLLAALVVFTLVEGQYAMAALAGAAFVVIVWKVHRALT